MRPPYAGHYLRNFWLRALAVVLAAPAAWSSVAPAQGRPNVVVFIVDDIRWDSLGAAGNPVVRTPRLDRLASEGVRFTQARVTTSICMVSRASLLTGQYMSRHGVVQFGKPLTREAFSNTYVGVLRHAGYWTGHVGKYDVGPPRLEDYDFLRAYHGRHWIEQPDGTRVHVTEKNARDAVDFLRARPRERPFLLTVGFFAPHAEDGAKEQYLPQDWSAGGYEGARVPPSPLGSEALLKALPPFLSADANEGRVRFKWRFDTPERYQSFMIRYYRLITEVDGAIGRVVDELRAQGAYDNTLIVAIGDNGYFHGDRGLADKWYPYEQALRVPLVVRDPRAGDRHRGRARDELALNIDVAPTIVAAAGLHVPDSMQGRDLAPAYLGGPAAPWRDEFFYEHPTITSRERIPASQGVIRLDWKYVYWPEWQYEQLFNLTTDPSESTNLIANPAAARQAATMREKAEAWRRAVK
jgi:arylsulfatase A-like enzyme